MSRLDRYILAQLFSLFGFFALILIGTYWINRALGIFDRLIADGQSVVVFFRLTVLFLPQVVAFMLPAATLAASLYVMNRILNESEFVVAEAAGASPLRMLRPVLLFSLAIFAMGTVLSNWLVPLSRVQMGIEERRIDADLTAKMIVEGSFVTPSKGVAFYIREIDPNGELRDVFLHDTRRPEQANTYTARRAVLVDNEGEPSLVMFEGNVQTFDTDTQQLSLVRFEHLSYGLESFISSGVERPSLRQFSTLVLINPSEALLGLTGGTRAQAQFIAFDRILQPVHALVYPVIAAAVMMLGTFSRFGLYVQMVGAIGAVLVVNVATGSLTTAASEDAAFIPLMFLPLGGGLIAAFLLCARARRPFRFRPNRPAQVPA